MSFRPLGIALVALLPLSSALSQSPSTQVRSERERRILMLDRTLPDLTLLREAIAASDTSRIGAAVESIDAIAVQKRAAVIAAVEALGGRVVRHWWIIDGILVEVPSAAAPHLAELPQVRSVWEDSPRAPGDAGLPILTSTNGLNHASDSVNARGVRGAGVTIAVIDSGLDSDMNGIGRPHATFFVQGNPNNQTGGGIGGSRMLANVQVGAQPADDSIDHGTRVAGVAIGARWNNSGVADDGHAPEARVVGYSLPELGGGFTVLSTMVQAWQNCTVDAVGFGTKVAVISYDGTSSALSPEQAAMDACADLADIFIAAMAGNTPSSSFFYQGAANVVTVGATQQDNRQLAGFSAMGPLVSDGLAPRRYPTCVANGDLITMPSANAEAGSVTRSGTSYSAPQVAGAAALFRSVSNASADATRAALAVTLEDGSGPNQSVINGIGLGYLRDDRLVDLAQGRLAGTIASGSVDVLNPGWSTTVTVGQGQVWSAALAWSRRDVSRTEWANLDLRVSQSGRELAVSRSTVDTLEFVSFQAPSAGTVLIEVSATSFEIGRVSQSFGIAASRSFRPVTISYGIGCEGARQSTLPPLGVEPSSLQSVFANGGTDILLGGLPHRTQQWIDTPGLNAAFSALGVAFRRDNTPGTWPAAWVDMSMTLSLTEATSASMSATFAQNRSTRTSQVIQRRMFALPAFGAAPATATTFDVRIPFDRPFDRLYDPFLGGTVQSLVMDVDVFGTSAGALPLSYPLDTVLGMTGARTLFAANPGAATGTFNNGLATVFGLVTDFSSGSVPTIAAGTRPSLGANLWIDASGGLPSNPVVLFMGLSNRNVAGTTLPLSLAPFGATGCFALTSMDFSLTGVTSTNGSASFFIPVPISTALRGQSLFHQAFLGDVRANALGFSTTAGLQTIFGT